MSENADRQHQEWRERQENREAERQSRIAQHEAERDQEWSERHPYAPEMTRSWLDGE